jgi:DNA replication ATP-dependent helicase Dna2
MATENLAAFQSELSEMVRRESEATRRAFHAQWDLPVPQRVDKGRCIDGLKFAAVEENRFLRFACSSGNSSDFREGDLGRLSRGQPTLPLLTGNLFRVDDDDVWFDPTENWRSFQHEIESGAWTLDPSYIDLDSLYQQAIAELGATARGRDRILPLLSGDLLPEVDISAFEEAATEAEKEGVNDAQSEAIAQAVATNLCHLVQGPPGTGKTFVLAQIVKQRVARGERILITALTHRAIHNALNMICRVAPEISGVVKIGREVYDPDLRVRQYPSFSSSPLATNEGGYVVGATPFSARSKRLRGV